jgi:ATP-binding cassette subfamily G (WHITE) protein 2 (PDR)
MSLVGNFTVNNDREGTHAGVPAADQVPRRASIHHQSPRTADSEASTLAGFADDSRTRYSHPNIEGSDHKHTSTHPHSEDITDEDDEVAYARREAEVHQLARRFTSQSTYSTTNQNPFNAPAGSALDPNGEHFNARAWCKAMLHLQSEDEKANPPRTAGVSFRNLNVHGFGSATDYQKSVGNVWLEGVGLVKKLMGAGKKTKINILRSLDGLVESGEMLVVLGPPGSGCSTFLKTITGETHGFVVEKDSYINYQGTSARTGFRA